MIFSFYGWCCADGCASEAVSRIRMGMDNASDLLVPVCKPHLEQMKLAIESLEGETLGVVRQ